mgnify:FL=1
MEPNCGICLEDREENDFKILPCSHKLCNHCLPKLLKTECPFCRCKFTRISEIREEIEYSPITNNVANIDEINIEQRYYDRLERRRVRRDKRRTRNNRRINTTQITIFEIPDDEEDTENHENITRQNNRYERRNNRWNSLRNQRRIINY